MAKSFDFPRIFRGNAVNIIEGRAAVIKQLQLLISSELFEFRFDPGYGSNLPLLKFRPKNKLTEDLIVDAVYELQNYCPNIRFDRSQVQVRYPEPAVIELTIPCVLDTDDYETDIVLYVEAGGV